MSLFVLVKNPRNFFPLKTLGFSTNADTLIFKDEFDTIQKTNEIKFNIKITGKEKERTKARKFIQALYDRGSDHQDKMVPVKMEMYGFASARPVLRHIVRESGAAIFVTFYGVAQV